MLFVFVLSVSGSACVKMKRTRDLHAPHGDYKNEQIPAPLSSLLASACRCPRILDFLIRFLYLGLCFHARRCNTHEPPVEKPKSEMDALELERVDESAAAAEVAENDDGRSTQDG